MYVGKLCIKPREAKILDFEIYELPYIKRDDEIMFVLFLHHSPTLVRRRVEWVIQV